REDETMKKELDKSLIMLKRSDKIEVWQDSMLSPGEEWADATKKQLAEADIILFLISVDFLNSQDIWEKEVAVAMDRQANGEARIVPIILRSCDWNDTPFAKFQALPAKAQPVNNFSDRDEAYTDIAKGIRALVDHMLTQLTSKKKPDEPEQKAAAPEDQNADTANEESATNDFYSETQIRALIKGDDPVKSVLLLYEIKSQHIWLAFTEQETYIIIDDEKRRSTDKMIQARFMKPLTLPLKFQGMDDAHGTRKVKFAGDKGWWRYSPKTFPTRELLTTAIEQAMGGSTSASA
ncbi:MAG TPA: toll/interleukin-1 receptor domain-containing protein, partial [Ferruginibacter sp.]|nr:toll/interleukin-1 receptor domain-containing protein [Ferruginibacter sp.]